MTFDFRSRFLHPSPLDFKPKEMGGDLVSVRKVQREGGLIWQLHRCEGTGKISLRFRQFLCPNCHHVTKLC